MRGQSDNRTGVIQLAKLLGRLVTIKDRHLHIHQHDIVWRIAGACGDRSLESRLTVIDDIHFGTGATDNMFEQPLIVRTVLGDQNAIVGEGFSPNVTFDSDFEFATASCCA